MQGGKYAAGQIQASTVRKSRCWSFKYFDKEAWQRSPGSGGRGEGWQDQAHSFRCPTADVVVHSHPYLVGFQKRVTTLGHWAMAFVGRARAERTITAYEAMGMADLVRARQRADSRSSTNRGSTTMADSIRVVVIAEDESLIRVDLAGNAHRTPDTKLWGQRAMAQVQFGWSPDCAQRSRSSM